MVDAIAPTTSLGASTWPPDRRPAGVAGAQDGGASDPSAPRGATGGRLSAEQQRQVREWQARDRAVRAHEAAHQAAGGSLSGGATFSYQVGPDGRPYAVGGEVSIDLGRERDPHATVSKMQRVIAAALAPADPSSQDQAVAAQARAIELQAEQLIAKQAEDGGQAKTADAVASSSHARATDAYGAQSGTTGGLLDVVA